MWRESNNNGRKGWGQVKCDSSQGRDATKSIAAVYEAAQSLVGVTLKMVAGKRWM